MTTRTVGRMAALVLLLSASAMLRAAEPLVSRWRAPEMKVDGAPDEWPALTTLSKQVSAAVANDADVLQIIVSVSDPVARLRLAAAGLMIYVDPANKNRQTFAVRIPPLGGRPVAGEPPRDPRITYVELIGAAKQDRHLVELPAANGIEASAAVHQGTLFLEVSVPFQKSSQKPYAPGIAAGQPAISIGFETPDPPTKSDDRPNAYGRGSTLGRMGATLPPGASIDGPPPNPDGKAFKVWTSVTLAQKAR